MKIDRVWAMPNRWTFSITPIAKLLREEMNGGIWIDPFSGMNSPATITNDLNPKSKAQFHNDALDFLKPMDTNSADGILYDPPYSQEQIRRSYADIGLKASPEKFTSHQYDVKSEIARIIKPGGKAICFGWNSMGMGKKRGFKFERILLIAHGRRTNDTIVTVERKMNGSLFN